MVFAYFRISSCRGVLRQHINRINYIFEIWKSEHIANPEIPEPAEIHGWTLVNGNLEPLWIIGNILLSKMLQKWPNNSFSIELILENTNILLTHETQFL